jgi:hypothetical protein
MNHAGPPLLLIVEADRALRKRIKRVARQSRPPWPMLEKETR